MLYFVLFVGISTSSPNSVNSKRRRIKNFSAKLEFIPFANICRKLIDIETNGNINTINCQIIGNFEDLDCLFDIYTDIEIAIYLSLLHQYQEWWKWMMVKQYKCKFFPKIQN